MTLIDLTNVRDLTVIDAQEGAAGAAAVGSCSGGACSVSPLGLPTNPQEGARG